MSERELGPATERPPGGLALGAALGRPLRDLRAAEERSGGGRGPGGGGQEGDHQKNRSRRRPKPIARVERLGTHL